LTRPRAVRRSGPAWGVVVMVTSLEPGGQGRVGRGSRLWQAEGPTGVVHAAGTRPPTGTGAACRPHPGMLVKKA